ncbi:hypothetical protein BDY24DRAFT_399150 [Mrakia frigida]|uniref:uncharacterized protein n=1 Tax=Mrakia frigida TaxID=29902 RepID=UPI003FCC16FF
MAYRDPYTHSDTPFRPEDQDQGYTYDKNGGYSGAQQVGGYSSSYEAEKVNAPPKSTGMLGEWRKQDRGKLLTRGGGCRSFGRCLGCTLIFTLVLVLTIIFTLALYIKPPNLVINSVEVGTPTVNITGTTPSLSIGFTASISVSNPNYFSATIKSLEAQAFYPDVATQIGGGNLTDVKFKSGSKTTFNFPFRVDYTTSLDSNNTIILDIVDRCGFLVAANKRNIEIDYNIYSKLSILRINISPTFDGSKSFECPFTLAQIAQLGISGVSGLL